MAQLTAQTVVRSLTYQSDAVNNIQEAPAGSHVTPADGSNPGNSLTAGKNVNITRIPKPGEGFPTGKSATHSSGTYKPLVTAILQQSTNTIDIDAATRVGIASPSHVSTGMSVIADAKANSSNALENSLHNDISTMSPAAQAGGTGTSTPTLIAGAAAGDGLSQGAETIN